MRVRPALLNKNVSPAIVGVPDLCFCSQSRCSPPRRAFPPLTGRVVDDAGILSPATRADLSAMLQRHEQATGEQVVVVTLPSLQGYSIEDFGYQLGRAWGIGQKDKNTGALLIVAPNEHKVRIEVGYGLEGHLPTRNPGSSSTATSCPNSGVAISTPACWPEPRRYLKVLGGDASAAQPPPGSGAPDAKIRPGWSSHFSPCS